MKQLVLIAVTPFLFAACAVTPQNQESGVSPTVQAAPAWIRPAATTACAIVLEGAVSAKDRVDKAIILNKISTIVAPAISGHMPSVGDFEFALSNFLPEKTHWLTLTQSISALYSGAYDQYVKGDAKLAALYVEQIVLGIKDATAPYIK